MSDRPATDPNAALARLQALVAAGSIGEEAPELIRLADLAVLDKDYLAVPSEELGTLTSLLTMVGGRVVYAAGPFAALGPDWRK